MYCFSNYQNFSKHVRSPSSFWAAWPDIKTSHSKNKAIGLSNEVTISHRPLASK